MGITFLRHHIHQSQTFTYDPAFFDLLRGKKYASWSRDSRKFLSKAKFISNNVRVNSTVNVSTWPCFQI